MRIRPGARTAVEGLTLLACAALGFYLLFSGRVHLFVGTIITTLLWVACPVLTVMGLWTLAHAVRHPNTTGHHRARIGLLIVAPVALGLFVPLEPLTLLGAASYRPAVRGTSSPPAHSSSWNNGLPAAPTSVSPVAIDPKTGKPSADTTTAATTSGLTATALWVHHRPNGPLSKAIRLNSPSTTTCNGLMIPAVSPRLKAEN
ncbi:hypothetical protein B1B12_08775 [Cutibacterium acnes subsp. defendens]|nr:hypothetical protein B1B12_08775 [Cutibacterium acnes subsp. defendens]